MTRTKHSGALVAIAGAAVLAASLLTLTALTAKPAEAAFPGVNGKITFASNPFSFSNPTGDYEIFTMNPDGTGITQLTFNTAVDFAPAWSADGTKIAFTSKRDGNAEVYTMSANGSDQTRHTTNSAFDGYPDWQPL